MRVRSGPMPASESAATTLTLAGKALTARVAGPSKISVSSVIASRSMRCSSIHGAPARPRGRLARLHGDRGDRALARALHAVEPGDGARGHEDAAAVLLGEPRPLVEHAHEPAHREHHEVLARAEHGGAEVEQRRLGGRLDDQIRAPDQLVERVGGEAARRGRGAHADARQRHAGNAVVDGLGDVLPMTPMPTMPTLIMRALLCRPDASTPDHSDASGGAEQGAC